MAEDPVDPRIASYREFLERVTRDSRDTKATDAALAQGPKDEVGALGESIVLMASKLADRSEQGRQLANVSREIVTGLEVDEVLDSIFDSFRPLVPYDRIGCALLERDGTIARARWSRSDNRTQRLKAGFSAKMAGSSLQAILDTGEPQIVNDLEGYAERHPGSVSAKLIVAEGMRSNITCPLISKGKPLGFLFFSSTADNCYTLAQRDMFLRLSDLVSIAISKGLVYEEMARLNEDLAEARTALEYRATHDDLTRLLNHAAIIAELVKRTDDETIWPYTEARSLCVIMIDIDEFKAVNDTFGHPVGDRTLRLVADSLAAQLRSSDRIGRYGGEEFLVVAETYEPTEPLALAERLRVWVETHPVVAKSGSAPITISLGLAVPEPGVREDCDSLIRRADHALYKAKGAGRNRVVVA